MLHEISLIDDAIDILHFFPLSIPLAFQLSLPLTQFWCTVALHTIDVQQMALLRYLNVTVTQFLSKSCLENATLVKFIEHFVLPLKIS